MNPVCPKIFDTNRSRKMVTCHALEMFMTFGESGATAECTFNKTEETSEEYEIPWDSCISLKVNNTDAIIDKMNPVASRFKEKIENCSSGGCVCHLAHTVASNANGAFI